MRGWVGLVEVGMLDNWDGQDVFEGGWLRMLRLLEDIGELGTFETPNDSTFILGTCVPGRRFSGFGYFFNGVTEDSQY